MEHVTVVTSALRQGDVVNCHGMRCLIDRPVMKSSSHPKEADVRYTRALVINRDEVPASAVPYGFTSADASRGDAPNEHRWTIQGNDLASWHVEV